LLIFNYTPRRFYLSCNVYLLEKLFQAECVEFIQETLCRKYRVFFESRMEKEMLSREKVKRVGTIFPTPENFVFLEEIILKN